MTSPFMYAEPPDVPEGMTLAEYRRLRCPPSRPRFLTRLRRSFTARGGVGRAARARGR